MSFSPTLQEVDKLARILHVESYLAHGKSKIVPSNFWIKAGSHTKSIYRKMARNILKAGYRKVILRLKK